MVGGALVSWLKAGCGCWGSISQQHSSASAAAAHGLSSHTEQSLPKRELGTQLC